MNKHYYCVILAGGIGSRFWPLSRESKPKQFLQLTPDGDSFIQMTYKRFAAFIPKENIFVVSLTRYKDQVMEHLPELPEDNLLLEPYSKNTAPSLAFATYSLLKRDPEAVMIASPADHVIYKDELFRETLVNALDFAAANPSLITLGIIPDRPDTNFGYIQGVGGRMIVEDGKPIKVKTFTEKPDAELAEVFFNTGEFFWNSGIFVWQAAAIRRELELHAPQITSLFRGWEENLNGAFEEGFLEKVYTSCEKISIDYAVMEKTDNAWVYPAKFGWHDIGNWEALYSYVASKDKDGNARHAGKAVLKKNSDCIFYSTDEGKLVAIKGLSNYLVVDTDDVLLICPRDEKSVKEMINNTALPDFEEFR